MTHAELVQAATDLLSEVRLSEARLSEVRLSEARGAERWLPLYDVALASPSDGPLVDLVVRLRRELRVMGSLAA